MTEQPHHIYEDSQQIPFEHVDLIGHGAQGSVDSVKRDGKLFARKTFVLSRTPKPQELERVIQETSITTRLIHEHIVRLVETYQHRNKYAIIMEPVAEGNLATYLADLDDVPLGQDQGQRERIVPWFHCLTNAIAYLHDKRILHRDIKPRNILTLRNNVLLTDFGISDEFQEATMSASSVVFGTRTYRSPEQDSGRRSGTRTDIFSLGAVFLEMTAVYGEFQGLRDLNAFLGGPYCQKTDRVQEWTQQLLSRCETQDTHQKPFWYGAMLCLCGLMLEKQRGNRPYATHLKKLWAYRTHEHGYETSWLPLARCACKSQSFGEYLHGSSWLAALSKATGGIVESNLCRASQKWASTVAPFYERRRAEPSHTNGEYVIYDNGELVWADSFTGFSDMDDIQERDMSDEDFDADIEDKNEEDAGSIRRGQKNRARAQILQRANGSNKPATPSSLTPTDVWIDELDEDTQALLTSEGWMLDDDSDGGRMTVGWDATANSNNTIHIGGSLTPSTDQPQLSAPIRRPSRVGNPARLRSTRLSNSNANYEDGEADDDDSDDSDSQPALRYNPRISELFAEHQRKLQELQGGPLIDLEPRSTTPIERPSSVSGRRSSAVYSPGYSNFPTSNVDLNSQDRTFQQGNPWASFVRSHNSCQMLRDQSSIAILRAASSRANIREGMTSLPVDRQQVPHIDLRPQPSRHQLNTQAPTHTLRASEHARPPQSRITNVAASPHPAAHPTRSTEEIQIRARELVSDRMRAIQQQSGIAPGRNNPFVPGFQRPSVQPAAPLASGMPAVP
jgi:serine/threonine protein kinase